MFEKLVAEIFPSLILKKQLSTQTSKKLNELQIKEMRTKLYQSTSESNCKTSEKDKV